MRTKAAATSTATRGLPRCASRVDTIPISAADPARRSVVHGHRSRRCGARCAGRRARAVRAVDRQSDAHGRDAHDSHHDHRREHTRSVTGLASARASAPASTAIRTVAPHTSATTCVRAQNVVDGSCRAGCQPGRAAAVEAERVDAVQHAGAGRDQPGEQEQRVPADVGRGDDAGGQQREQQCAALQRARAPHAAAGEDDERGAVRRGSGLLRAQPRTRARVAASPGRPSAHRHTRSHTTTPTTPPAWSSSVRVVHVDHDP